jgi:hypothetical protein
VGTTAEVLMLGKESPWCKIEAPEFSCQGRNQHGAKSRRQNSHVREGINMVQTEGAGILMSAKESTWCNTEKIQKFFFVRNTSRNADEKDLLKARGNKREEVAAYNPYLLHKV